VRSISELQKMMAAEPFPGPGTEGTKALVTFTEVAKDIASRLPLSSPRGDLTIVAASGRELFSLCCKSDEKHALPSDFIEELVGRRSTTRYWDTVLGLLEKEREWRL
ncbi:MAG: hypothetical protein WCK39_08305, partial [Methanomassiliicoccales archaeon]